LRGENKRQRVILAIAVVALASTCSGRLSERDEN